MTSTAGFNGYRENYFLDPPRPEPAAQSIATAPDAIPAWRKAVEHLENDRAGDVLPALPAPHILGIAPPDD
ncbi:MAG: hypothetical protein WCP35_21065 [Verrucomicrobiota bacterium]